MKWLEIIELRSMGNNRKLLESNLKNLIDELNEETEQQAIKIYDRVQDFSCSIFGIFEC